MDVLEPSTDLISLSSGEALLPEDLAEVTSREETTVVLVAGPAASGRTTILVALYELFNQGPVGGLLFAGSETLVGFERICHPGRAASGRQHSETQRTGRLEGAGFLHLRVVDAANGAPRTSNLLISDITGEAFEETLNVAEPTFVPRQIWRRADVLSVVLDGEKLQSKTMRHSARSDARSLLRSAKESGLVSRKCRLVIVTTKWDLVEAAGTVEYVAATEALLTEQSQGAFASVACHRIAARPTSQKAPYAYGVPRLLIEWVSRPSSRTRIAIPRHVGSALSDFVAAFWVENHGTLSGTFDAA